MVIGVSNMNIANLPIGKLIENSFRCGSEVYIILMFMGIENLFHVSPSLRADLSNCSI